MGNKDSGFSLIELMVAMLIGLFLVFVVISSYSGTKASSTLRSEQGELEANARIAMTLLRDGIEHAGYPSTYIHILTKPFLTESDGEVSGFICKADGTVSFQEINAINNSNRYTQDSYGKDRITVAYMPDNPNDPDALYWQDCAGLYSEDAATNSIQAEQCSADPILGQGHNAVVYNAYFISNGELKCTSSRNKTVPLARGVERIQYRYGVKISGNTTYQDADTVEANAHWDKVVNVQIAMLMRSESEVLPQEERRKYKLFEKQFTFKDRYLRKVYTSTVHLVNIDRT